MSRTLYRCLVRLHPPVFRREFAGEMLWIYDETARAEGRFALLVDGLLSLARQWIVRSGCWKILAALAGGLFQVSIGGALMFRIDPYLARPAIHAVENPEIVSLIRLAALTAVGLLAAVISLVFWWRRLARRAGI